MKTIFYAFGALLLVSAVTVLYKTTAAADSRVSSVTVSHRPELEYLKAVNSVAPPQDPQLLFLLMAEYANANLQGEGAEFFSARLKEFGPRLTDVQKALYLSAIGLLRAQNASSVSLWHRIGYVKDTVAMLEQAKQLSGGQVFVVNWIAGVVYAQLPSIFHQKEAAQRELAWCAANADKAPHAGWLREVYYQQARLALADGDQAKVSDDRRELISIDAGTRPDSAQAAYEALQAYAPGLPELTTVFVTHSHWDHIGGQKYFRALNPHVRFYARSNYEEESTRQIGATFRKQFFGERFNFDDVRSFKPDVTIDRSTDLRIGGTRIELIPVQGGETRDAMFIHLPDLGVLFVGDFIMPYLGAPFTKEGNLQGLLDAIDIVAQKNPRYLLHGHEPMTRNFNSPALLSELKTDLEWLREQVLTAIRRGDERAAIYQANLTPPGLLNGRPDVYLPYMILRGHFIDRLYDQNVGYWQPDLQGLDHLTRADHAELVDYLSVSERQFVKAVERLAADGKYELAASLLESSGDRFDHSPAVANAKRLVYLKLMEKNQNTDPFKFILYSGKIAEQTPQMAATK
jgi:glyoxylase-like metal-dependent hydrolase (beta-lactamase superfamily II)